ncbi:GGDEF domain-containing protein [Niveispirillum sp. KHB5.9]|uniref:GGDEF domain-containing protein n=1 Tax=Niveispirillum sp. KHB5.9 TaxID=3400269 RepID=UPI003A8B20E6
MSGGLDGLLLLAALLVGAGITGVVLRLRRSHLERQRHLLDNLVAGRTSELRHALAALERLAGMDPLTEVMNRRRFMEMAAAELARADRTGRPVAVAMLDLDHFKQINDRHGHLAGDEALKLVARQLAKQCRVSDLLARFGGEEFVLLLPETGLAGAMTMLERVRVAIAGSGFRHDGRAISLTASIGLAVREDRPESLDRLLARADHALYEAKRGGRNRVVAS